MNTKKSEILLQEYVQEVAKSKVPIRSIVASAALDEIGWNNFSLEEILKIGLQQTKSMGFMDEYEEFCCAAMNSGYDIDTHHTGWLAIDGIIQEICNEILEEFRNRNNFHF